MRKWYPIFRDFYLTGVSLVERRTSPDQPSVMQTILFRKKHQVQVANSRGQAMGKPRDGEMYFWVEAKRIEPEKYTLVAKGVICCIGTENTRRAERISSSDGRTIFTTREAADLLRDFELDEIENSENQIVRTAAWTPMHCSRWAGPPGKPPGEKEPIPDPKRPEGENVIVFDLKKKLAA